MAAPTVRSDYDQLQGIASSFNSQSEATQKSLQQIKSCLDTLKGGDWIGKGATAFFKEMDDSVVPTLKRLEQALSQAGKVTTQISQLMKQAEDEASSCFHL